jgi:hypothetical protein
MMIPELRISSSANEEKEKEQKKTSLSLRRCMRTGSSVMATERQSGLATFNQRLHLNIRPDQVNRDHDITLGTASTSPRSKQHQPIPQITIITDECAHLQFSQKLRVTQLQRRTSLYLTPLHQAFRTKGKKIE